MATYPTTSTSQTDAPERQGGSSGSLTEIPGSESERGRTTIVDGVVAKVAGLAAREVEGVHAMGKGAARAIGNVTSKVGLGDDRGQGVSVEVGQREAAADLVLVIEFGVPIRQVCDEVRANVINRIEAICGLTVTEVNIVVNDLHFPGDDEDRISGSRVQ